MENAVVYARYSSHNQTEQSIEGQLAAARKYAETKGYSIIHEYCDRAKTGTNDNREAFQEMLHDCQTHTFSVIIVWKVDRFGRNREEITFNKYRAKKHGVRVEYIAENISEGPEGVILEAVLEGMAEYYSLQLSQNVKRGHLESAKKYRSVGGRAPLGYKTNEKGEYVIDDDTAPIVKLIYSKYASGETMADIIRYLNANGYRNCKNMLFTKNSLPTILSNEKYIGTYRFRDLVYEENVIPAIIDRDLFYEVQRLKQVNRRKPSRKWKYSDYLLTEKLFCGECGRPIIGKSGYGKMKVKYGYYTCLGKIEKICTLKPSRKEWLEELVLREIVNMISEKETLEYIVNLVWSYYQEQEEQDSELERLEIKLKEVNQAMLNIVKSVERGMPYELVSERLGELEQEKELYTRLIGEKKLHEKFKLTKEHIEYFMKQFVNMNYTDRSCQKRLIQCFVNKIYLYHNKVIVAINCVNENQRLISIDDIEKAHSSVLPCAPNQELANSKRTFVCNGSLVLEIYL